MNTQYGVGICSHVACLEEDSDFSGLPAELSPAGSNWLSQSVSLFASNEEGWWSELASSNFMNF